MNTDMLHLFNQLFPLGLVIVLAVFAIKYRNMLVAATLAMTVLSVYLRVIDDPYDGSNSTIVRIILSVLITILLIKEMILEEKQRVQTQQLLNLSAAMEEHNGKKKD